MKKSNISKYISRFFDHLVMFEDAVRGHNYKAYLKSTILRFLDNESPETAYDVYQSFFDCYRISLPGDSNPFSDIVDILRQYEEGAGSFIDKQRDHYLHAVNVFLTGLSVYASTETYRNAFSEAIVSSGYQYAYPQTDEEFLYRWGIAALFHDIGYPLEIANNQIERFLRTILSVDDEDSHVRVSIAFDNFDNLNKVKEVLPKEVFCEEYARTYDDTGSLDLLKPLDIMAHHICQCFHTDLETTKKALDNSVARMIESGFIDHGFYSALIVMKWYGLLIQQCRYNPAYFYWPVTDAAVAILLHNYYKHGLQKEPFDLGPMHAADNPIAFLLILCDELQEWNRKAHGLITRTFELPESVNFIMESGFLTAIFITPNRSMPESFCQKKKTDLLKMLDLEAVFPKGIVFENAAIHSISHLKQGFPSTPRPIFENIERLAITIHSLYNEDQVKRYPDKPLAYPAFSDLPDDLKYSNIRQAQGIYSHLAAFGLTVDTKGKPGQLAFIENDLLESMAEREHNMWVYERIQSGWSLGEKDTANKKTPYLIPYANLSEEIKELDRNVIRNIPLLLDSLDLGIYKIWGF